MRSWKSFKSPTWGIGGGEVSPVDPVTWLAIGLVLTFVVLAAGLWPAERAARIEPTEALRYE